MGFYGNITNTARTQFQFDLVYPNRREMEKGTNTDGIYAGRYILIEYDGEQHFKTAFGQQEEKLILQQLYDNIKTEWCSKNNIKLIRIPYNHKNIKISDIIQ